MAELGLRATASEIEDMISEIDLDQTGTVDLEGMPKTPSRAANANISRNRVH
jgi:Ca2+-binding EF-hand superfamily protein